MIQAKTGEGVSPEQSTDVDDDLGMTRAGVLTDELWVALEPELPSDVGRRGSGGLITG